MKTSDCERKQSLFFRKYNKIERNKVLKFYLETDSFRLIVGLNDKRSWCRSGT